jgi:hypothetical protein
VVKIRIQRMEVGLWAVGRVSAQRAGVHAGNDRSGGSMP